MNCQNCGKKEATVRYTQIINGIKSEIRLCESCAKKLGVSSYQFDLPMGFADFLGDFFEDYEADMLPNFLKEEVTCKICGSRYEDFMQNGLLGCPDCYEVFSYRLDPIINKLQGSTKHIGRGIKSSKRKNIREESKIINNLKEKVASKENIDTDKESKIKKLNTDLKKAIKEERYEDAATIRDEIKKYNEKNN